MEATHTPDLTMLGNPEWYDNWTRGLFAMHGEIMDPSAGTVWLAQDPMTPERFEALELPDDLVKTGIGESVADAAYFRRSPGAECDGPLQARDIDGIRFALVARPGLPETSPAGVFTLPVYKHHRVMFKAGRTIEVMSCGDGLDYVPLVARARMAGRATAAADRPPRPRRLPEGWSVRNVSLTRDLVVELPCPTRAVFFSSGDSFQGPLQLGV